jgi:hypothetical protein
VDEERISSVHKLGNQVAITLDGGDGGIFVFDAEMEGVEEVSYLDGDWRRIWP